MQLYFITRGIKNKVDQMITELQGKYLPIKIKVNEKGEFDDNGTPKDMMVQLGVRPIQLWEVAYPKECNDIVLNSILKGGDGHRSQKEHKRIMKYLGYPFKKMLGLKDIDPNYSRKSIMPVQVESIDIIALGVREDKEFKWGEGI